MRAYKRAKEDKTAVSDTKIIIKNEEEIDLMRLSGRAVARVHKELTSCMKPGITTKEIDDYCAELIKKQAGKSAFHGYRGYPGQLCISVNEEVVHGIGGKKRLQYGDVVKLDVGIKLNGYIGDSAVTHIVGSGSAEVERLVRKTEDSMWAGIAQARAGNRLGDVCHAIEKCVLEAGYTVVREFVGHGVGASLHEAPQIPNYGRPNKGPKLKPGMTLAIEPMVNMGSGQVRVLSDGWTVVTIDGKASSHWEHTVLVTEGAPEILTTRDFDEEDDAKLQALAAKVAEA